MKNRIVFIVVMLVTAVVNSLVFYLGMLELVFFTLVLTVLFGIMMLIKQNFKAFGYGLIGGAFLLVLVAGLFVFLMMFNY